MPTTSVSGRLSREEFARLRAMIHESNDDVATILSTTPARLAEYASGTRRVPASTGKRLRWYANVQERAAALEACSLPECSEVKRLEDAVDESDDSPDISLAELEKRLDALKRHKASCKRCLDRERYIDERFGPMPEIPGAGLLDFSVFEHVPEALRPAAAGAILLGIVVAGRMAIVVLFVLLFGRSLPVGGWTGMFTALGAAMAAGAAGGLTYTIARPLKRFGRPGQYVLGVVMVCAYMGLLALLAPYAFGESLIKEKADVVIFAAVSVFFGLVVGHSMFKD